MPRVVGMRGAWLALAVLCGSCSYYDESFFVPEYAEIYCDLVMQCGTGAEMTFDGYDSKKECLAKEGPRIDDWGEGCTYKHKAASACIEEFGGAKCPGSGDVDAAVPAVCGDVYEDCARGDNALDTASL
jgi:hypothetical protein